MTRDELTEWCYSRDACDDALAWIGSFPESATLTDVWSSCKRGDWMLWLATNAGVDRRRLVEASCGCAETALVHVTSGEERPAHAIAVARAWAHGAATYEDVRAAALGAAQAAYDAAGPSAHAAARAASYAAYAACGACAPSYAAEAAAYAAHAAYTGSTNHRFEALNDARAQHAELVRRHISAADVGAAMEAAR